MNEYNSIEKYTFGIKLIKRIKDLFYYQIYNI